MNAITSFASAYVGGKMMKHMNVHQFPAIVRGEAKASRQQANAAQLFLDLTSNPSVSDAVMEVAVDGLRGRGIGESDLLALAASLAPVLDTDAPKSMKQLMSVARTLAQRVVNAEDTDKIQHAATVVCPRCQYVHAIEG